MMTKLCHSSEEEDYQLARVVEEGLITPPTEVDSDRPMQPISLFRQLLEVHKLARRHRSEDTQSELLDLQKDSENDRPDNRFEDS